MERDVAVISSIRAEIFYDHKCNYLKLFINQIILPICLLVGNDHNCKLKLKLYTVNLLAVYDMLSKGYLFTNFRRSNCLKGEEKQLLFFFCLVVIDTNCFYFLISLVFSETSMDIWSVTLKQTWPSKFVPIHTFKSSIHAFTTYALHSLYIWRHKWTIKVLLHTFHQYINVSSYETLLFGRWM